MLAVSTRKLAMLQDLPISNAPIPLPLVTVHVKGTKLHLPPLLLQYPSKPHPRAPLTESRNMKQAPARVEETAMARAALRAAEAVLLTTIEWRGLPTTRQSSTLRRKAQPAMPTATWRRMLAPTLPHSMSLLRRRDLRHPSVMCQWLLPAKTVGPQSLLSGDETSKATRSATRVACTTNYMDPIDPCR